MSVEIRVLSDRLLPDHAGRPVPVKRGQLFKIDNRRVLQKLLANGSVALLDAPGTGGGTLPPLSSPTAKKRIGVFAFTSTHYSGGRIHLWQMAWSLADLGHEVWFVTNRVPMWEKDYPANSNLKLITDKNPALPADFDYVVTDGKRGEGKAAINYRSLHPHAKLCILNFETPHWVAKYDPATAAKMEDTVPVLKEADILLANSEDSCQDVREVLGATAAVTAVPPVVNTSAIDVENVTLPKEVEMHGDTPYVVWVARGSAYKGIQDAVNAVKSFPGKLNLYAMGHPGNIFRSNDDNHKFISFGQSVTDAQKMALISGAAAVLAPSKFEGYGMVPGESLCCGTPVVVYDLPVLHANYGDRLIYAKWGDSTDFTKKVKETVQDAPTVDKAEAQGRYGLQAMGKLLGGIPAFQTGKRVSAQLICYYGPTVAEAIASVYPHVDEILIAYGPTLLWKDKAPDNALELIKAFPDPDKKIKLEIRDVWQNKTEMRQWCATNATGNRMLIFDADEIYHNLDKWIEADPLAGCPRWVHFWHDADHYVTDRAGDQRWGRYDEGTVGAMHPHYRWSQWRRSYHFAGSKGVRGQDIKEQSLNTRKLTEEADAVCPECVIYHLGHTLSKERMKEKHDFYLRRDGRNEGRTARKKAWHDWNGTTGEQADGVIRKVDWKIPSLVKKAFKKLGHK
jgi:glycosyltransferase involved in cell wall biosynthesis